MPQARQDEMLRQKDTELYVSTCPEKVTLHSSTRFRCSEGKALRLSISTATTVSSSANDEQTLSLPTLPLRRFPTDAEIWSEVRAWSPSQLKAYKSLLQQHVKSLNKALAARPRGDSVGDIQSLQKTVGRYLEIVKNAMHLRELLGDEEDTSQSSSTNKRPSLAELKAERKRIHKELKTFEEQFAVQHGRPISSAADIEPHANQYRRLQKLQGAMALLRLEQEYKRSADMVGDSSLQ